VQFATNAPKVGVLFSTFQYLLGKRFGLQRSGRFWPLNTFRALQHIKISARSIRWKSVTSNICTRSRERNPRDPRIGIRARLLARIRALAQVFVLPSVVFRRWLGARPTRLAPRLKLPAHPSWHLDSTWNSVLCFHSYFASWPCFLDPLSNNSTHVNVHFPFAPPKEAAQKVRLSLPHNKHRIFRSLASATIDAIYFFTPLAPLPPLLLIPPPTHCKEKRLPRGRGFRHHAGPDDPHRNEDKWNYPS
jgi:hypothetical protein